MGPIGNIPGGTLCELLAEPEEEGRLIGEYSGICEADAIGFMSS